MNFLVLGASGQTGSYLAQILESNPANKVFSASRGQNPYFVPQNYLRISKPLEPSGIREMIIDSEADVVINLISLSSVFECERNQETSQKLNFLLVQDLVTSVLEAQFSLSKSILVFQCSSSEMYSNLKANSIITENTDLNPGTAYGKHKALALEHLRNTTGANADFKYASGILFNHESPRRSGNFVSKKIVDGVRAIASGKSDFLELGDISVERDWSYAPDFAEGIASLVQSRKSGEYVFASGKLHSVAEFCELTFKQFGLENYTDFLRVNPEFLRKNNNNGLIGDSTKLRNELAWSPKVDFPELVRIMAAQ